MTIRCPKDLFALNFELMNDCKGTRASDHPVSLGFDGSTSIGIDHHLTIGMQSPKSSKITSITTQIKRAGRFQIRHEYPFLRTQNLGSLTHKAHTSHDEILGGMILTKAGHFQRIGHKATGFEGKILNIAIDIVVRNQGSIFLDQ